MVPAGTNFFYAKQYPDRMYIYLNKALFGALNLVLQLYSSVTLERSLE
jgi:hypothetical protein